MYIYCYLIKLLELKYDYNMTNNMMNNMIFCDDTISS